MRFKIETLLPIGYLLIMLLGGFVLSISWLHSESAAMLDHFFIAFSAVSTTGLVTIDPGATYNFGGELFILVLIQIGGLGYMSIGSFIMFVRSKKLGENTDHLMKSDVAMPEQFDTRQFVRTLVLYSFAIELIGAVLFYFIFSDAGIKNPIWHAVFHSISAFCTAGFSLNPDSLSAYGQSTALNLTVTFLSLSGALGFIVMRDLTNFIARKSYQMTFTTKIILFSTFFIMLGAFLAVVLAEPHYGQYDMSGWEPFFQVMTAFTTVGFNTAPIGELHPGVLFLIIVLMLVGASPSGTGGGIKTTTISSVWATLLSELRGGKYVSLLGSRIPAYRQRQTTANLVLYFVCLIVVLSGLLLTQDVDPFSLIFEAISAIGTVGLSMGATGELDAIGKLLIIVLMFLGRIGPLALGLILFRKASAGEIEDSLQERDIIIG